MVCLAFGELDVRPLIENEKDRLIQFLIQALEVLGKTTLLLWKWKYRPEEQEFEPESSLPHTQFTILIDLKGLSYAKVAHKKCMF